MPLTPSKRTFAEDAYPPFYAGRKLSSSRTALKCLNFNKLQFGFS